MIIMPTCKYCSKPIEQYENFCSNDCKILYNVCSFKEGTLVMLNLGPRSKKSITKWKDHVGRVTRVNKNLREIRFTGEDNTKSFVLVDEKELVMRD
jgi:ribosomal protein L24E